MATQQQIEANRQNAQHSPGPTSIAGKQKSALNSVTHGFTGQTVVLPEAEKEPYRLFAEGLVKDLAPVGVHETALVHSIIDNRWRTYQIASMESALYAMGFHKHASEFPNETPERTIAMCRLVTFEEKRKELDRLHRYESRLTRQANKDMQLLTQLQTTRKALEAQREKEAIALHTHFTTAGKTWNPAEFGFVLSIAEIEALEARQFLRNTVCKA